MRPKDRRARQRSVRGVNEIVASRPPSDAKERTRRAPADAEPRPSNSTCTALPCMLSFFPFVKSSSQSRAVPSLSSNTSVTQARAAVMTEQTMHSSCSTAHARPLVAMHRTVTARVSVTGRTAAIKVSSSFHAANSLCAGCGERCLLLMEVVRHVSVVVVDGSGRAYP